MCRLGAGKLNRGHQITHALLPLCECTNTYTNTQIQKYINTQTQIQIHKYNLQKCKSTENYTRLAPVLRMHKYTNTNTQIHIQIHINKNTKVQKITHALLLLCKYTNTEIHKYKLQKQNSTENTTISKLQEMPKM